METVIPTQTPVHELVPGQELSAYPYFLSFARVAQATATMGDWFPGHYDPHFAAEQGKPTIYANTYHIQGLLDKYVLDQLGADRVIRRRRMWMRRSVLADTKLTITGTVRSVDPAQGQAVIAVSCAVDGEEAVTAEVIVGDAYAAAAE